MLNGDKSIFLSTTFYGVVISVIAVVLNMFGIQLNDQAGWVNDVAALVGAVVALIGRVKATKKVSVLIALFALTFVSVAQAANPDPWSRQEWRYVGKTSKVAMYNLVVPAAGVASGDTLTGVGPALPPNSIVTNVTYHISTEFVGASDNAISMNCIASGDLMTGLQLNGDAALTVASGGVVSPETHSSYVKTTSTGCSPTFYVGTGASGYTAGQLQALVEYMQIFPEAGLAE
jgi:hypothetical protein